MRKEKENSQQSLAHVSSESRERGKIVENGRKRDSGECDSFLFVNLFKFDKKGNRNFPDRMVTGSHCRLQMTSTPTRPYANRMLLT